MQIMKLTQLVTIHPKINHSLKNIQAFITKMIRLLMNWKPINKDHIPEDNLEEPKMTIRTCLLHIYSTRPKSYQT